MPRKWVCLLLVSFCLLAPTLAEANGGPVRLPPPEPGGWVGVPIPVTNTQVHVMAEWLTFEVAPDLGSATVTARYLLKNTSGRPAEVDVGFEAYAASDLRVSFNGSPVPVTQVADTGLIEYPLGALLWHNPYTGEPEDAMGNGSTGMSTTTFPLVISPERDNNLVVQFTQKAGISHHRSALKGARHFHYVYPLSPARRWAGFENFTVKVILPPDTVMKSNLSTQRGDDGAYHVYTPGLPEGEFSFSLAPDTFLGRLSPWAPMLVIGGLAPVLGVMLATAAASLARRLQLRGRGVPLALIHLFGWPYLGIKVIVWLDQTALTIAPNGSASMIGWILWLFVVGAASAGVSSVRSEAA